MSRHEIEVTEVIPLPQQDSGLSHSIIRFHNSRIDAKRQDPRRFHRREPVVIVNPETGTKTLRYAMGSAGLAGLCKTVVALDYDGIDALGIRFRRPVHLVVRRASTPEVLAYYWAHPDLGIQLSTRLGMIGALLGVMGFAIGVISMV